jgi:hypothetical protein
MTPDDEIDAMSLRHGDAIGALTPSSLGHGSIQC